MAPGFHPAKCKVMRLGTKHPEYQYNMHDASGERVDLITVDTEKDLGINFDRDLTFSQHMVSASNKANRMMGMIRRSFVFLDEYIFTNLFKMLVRPHLEYGNIIWAPYLRKDIDLIENVQRRATKLVPGLSHMPYESRLKKLKLPSLEYRRVRGDMIELYKYTHGIYHVDANWLQLDTSTRTRGHMYKLKKTSCNSEKRKHVFSL